MSAYLVQPETIAKVLVTHFKAEKRYKFSRYNVDEADYWIRNAAKLLATANVESVNYRYTRELDEDDKQFISESIEAALKLIQNYDANAFEPVQAIKSCHCINYQSCEVDGWEQSKACELLNEIIKAQTYILPGYDEAEWG